MMNNNNEKRIQKRNEVSKNCHCSGIPNTTCFFVCVCACLYEWMDGGVYPLMNKKKEEI